MQNLQQIMEDQDFQIELIKQLLSTINFETLRAVQILDKHGMIIYLTFEGLLKFMQQINASQSFIQCINDDFNKFLEKTADKTIKYKFPIVLKHCSQNLMYEKRMMFMDKYQEENGKQRRSQRRRRSSSEYRVYNQPTTDFDEQFFLDFKFKNLKYQKFFIKKQKETQKWQQGRNADHPNQCKRQNIHYCMQKKDFNIQNYVIKDHKHAVVPEFFYKDKNGWQRISTKRLLSFNVSTAFQGEFDEVKQFIYEQLIQSNGYLINAYQKLAQNYIKLFLIKSGRCQPTHLEDNQNNSLSKFIEDYKTNYLSKQNLFIEYCYPHSTSPLLSYWNDIITQLECQLRHYLYTHDQIRILLEGSLKTSELFYTPCFEDQYVFGCGSLQIILININHIAQNKSSFEDFKTNIVKPLIALTLYHGLAYKLIRNINKENLFNDSSISISLQSDTYGCRILKFIQENSSKIKSFLELTQTNYHRKINQNNVNVESIKIIIQDIYKLLEKYRSIKEIIQNNDLLNEIKETLNAVKISWQAADSNHLEKQFQSQATKYFQNKIQIDQTLNYHKEIQYKFVFSLLFTAQQMGLRLKKRGDQQQQQQMKKRDKYFVGQNVAIENFLFQIKHQKPNIFDQIAITFSEFILQSETVQESFNNLFQKYEKFLALIDREMVERFNRSSRNYSKYFQRANTLQDYRMIDQISRKLIRDKNIRYDMGQIFEFPHNYNSLMSILKYSELYLMGSQAPDFFMLEAQEPYQPGFNLQRRIFPKLKRYLYFKDYKIFKTLCPKNAAQIGVSLKKHEETEQRIVVARSFYQQDQLKRRMSPKVSRCGRQIQKRSRKERKQREKQ